MSPLREQPQPPAVDLWYDLAPDEDELRDQLTDLQPFSPLWFSALNAGRVRYDWPVDWPGVAPTRAELGVLLAAEPDLQTPRAQEILHALAQRWHL